MRRPRTAHSAFSRPASPPGRGCTHYSGFMVECFDPHQPNTRLAHSLSPSFMCRGIRGTAQALVFQLQPCKRRARSGSVVQLRLAGVKRCSCGTAKGVQGAEVPKPVEIREAPNYTDCFQSQLPQNLSQSELLAISKTFLALLDFEPESVTPGAQRCSAGARSCTVQIWAALCSHR